MILPVASVYAIYKHATQFALFARRVWLSSTGGDRLQLAATSPTSRCVSRFPCVVTPDKEWCAMITLDALLRLLLAVAPWCKGTATSTSGEALSLEYKSDDDGRTSLVLQLANDASTSHSEPAERAEWPSAKLSGAKAVVGVDVGLAFLQHIVVLSLQPRLSACIEVVPAHRLCISSEGEYGRVSVEQAVPNCELTERVAVENMHVINLRNLCPLITTATEVLLQLPSRLRQRSGSRGAIFTFAFACGACVVCELASSQ